MGRTPQQKAAELRRIKAGHHHGSKNQCHKTHKATPRRAGS